MSFGRPRDKASPLFRYAALWSALLLVAMLLAATLPTVFAQTGATANEAIPVGRDGRFGATTAGKQSTWFRFAYAGSDQLATITVQFTPADADQMDLAEYTGSADNPRQESVTPTHSGSTLSITFSDPTSRDLFVKVINNGDKAVAYSGYITPSAAVATLPPGTSTPTVGPVANSAADAITVGADGSFLGNLGPQRAVWYRFWYANAGVDATASVTFAQSADVDNADLNIYSGTDVTNLGPTKQSGAATRAGDILSRRINLANPQWVYFNITNNNADAVMSYSGKLSPSFAPPSVATATATPVATATPAPTATPQAAPGVPHDERYFTETGYRIDNDQVWGYFRARGAIRTFGYPVSRTFTFLGCQVQIFQRQVAQACAGRGPALLNLLDPDIFPYTRVNGSTFPAPNAALKDATPRVSDPNYAAAIIDFVRASAPDVWGGQNANFGQTFLSSINPELAGTSDPGILGLLNLEVWGAPISQPMRDPNNNDFIYQRFQRGIMHYRASLGVTEGILLADYLKSIMTGQNLPADLQAEAQGSKFYLQYCPGATNWLCRPTDLTGTDLTFAFERG